MKHSQNNVQQGVVDNLFGLKGGNDATKRWWNEVNKCEPIGSYVPIGVLAKWLGVAQLHEPYSAL